MKYPVVLVAVVALLSSSVFALNVGFDELRISNGSEPELTAGVWYPTDASMAVHGLGNFRQTVALDSPVAGGGLPLVVMSHGGGGWFGSHYDTALALARAGFVVAAVSHAGDTYDDQSRVLELWRRPDQLRRLVDYMLAEWPRHGQLDVSRVGAFGFSNGGFTVLVAAGGNPDLSEIGRYCAAHPSHDLCLALKEAGADPHLGNDVPASVWISDSRIRTAVVVAPAFGFAFDQRRLSDVRVPVQLWRAADDRHQPQPYYEEVVAASLPRAPEYHVVDNAGHYDFLPPCDARMLKAVPVVCTSSPGFDREAFHEQFNAEIVRFFRATLR